jgi:hypothetical protein
VECCAGVVKRCATSLGRGDKSEVREIKERGRFDLSELSVDRPPTGQDHPHSHTAASSWLGSRSFLFSQQRWPSPISSWILYQLRLHCPPRSPWLGWSPPPRWSISSASPSPKPPHPQHPTPRRPTPLTSPRLPSQSRLLPCRTGPRLSVIRLTTSGRSALTSGLSALGGASADLYRAPVGAITRLGWQGPDACDEHGELLKVSPIPKEDSFNVMCSQAVLTAPPPPQIIDVSAGVVRSSKSTQLGTAPNSA